MEVVQREDSKAGGVAASAEISSENLSVGYDLQRLLFSLGNLWT